MHGQYENLHSNPKGIAIQGAVLRSSSYSLGRNRSAYSIVRNIAHKIRKSQDDPLKDHSEELTP